jgi:hypothetical protein
MPWSDDSASTLPSTPEEYIRLPSCVTLKHLADLPDIWEIICANLSGDAMYRLAQTPDVRAATMLTPAFMMLAGCDYDGNLVPWRDTANTLTPKAVKRSPTRATLISKRAYRGAAAFFDEAPATLRSQRVYRGAAAFFDEAPVGCGPYKSVAFTRSHDHTYPRPHVSLQHGRTLTRSHVHIVLMFKRSHVRTITRIHAHTFTLSHVHTFTRSLAHTCLQHVHVRTVTRGTFSALLLRDI